MSSRPGAPGCDQKTAFNPCRVSTDYALYVVDAPPRTNVIEAFVTQTRGSCIHDEIYLFQMIKRLEGANEALLARESNVESAA